MTATRRPTPQLLPNRAVLAIRSGSLSSDSVSGMALSALASGEFPQEVGPFVETRDSPALGHEKNTEIYGFGDMARGTMM